VLHFPRRSRPILATIQGETDMLRHRRSVLELFRFRRANDRSLLRRATGCVAEALEDRTLFAWNLTLGDRAGSAPTSNVSSSTTAGTTTFTATGTGANLNLVDVEGALQGGNNVVITSGSTGTEPGDIDELVGDQLLGLPANLNLTIQSGRNVGLLALYLQSSNGSVTIDAGGYVSTGVLGGGSQANPAPLASVTINAPHGAIAAEEFPFSGPVNATTIALQALDGIGVSGPPLMTQTANLSAQTVFNGIFISNSGDLNINGGVIPGVNGVQVTAQGDISLANAGNLAATTNGDIIKGPRDVTVQATGASSDIATGGQSNLPCIGGLRSGAVTVTAGRDILLGDASGFGSVRSVSGSITLMAGRDLVMNANSDVSVLGGGGALTATVGRNITMLTSPGNLASPPAPALATSGGNITVTTGAGGALTAASTGTNAVSSSGGNVTISADSMLLNQGIDAGRGIVTLQQVTGGRNIDLGLGTTAGDLDLSDAALGNVTAGVLRIGRTDNSGNLTLTGQVTAHAGFSTLSLLTGGGVLDSNFTEPDIAVTNLAIQSASGINLDTAVSTLAFTNTAGFIFIRNTGGPLTVGSVDGLSASSNSGLTTNISAASPITFAANVTSAGTLTAMTADDGPVHTDNITVESGMSIDCNGGDVILEAGDDIVIDSGATVKSTTANVDLRSGSSDTDGEGVMTIDGTVSAAGTVALNVNAANASEPPGTSSVSESATGSIVASGFLLLKSTVGLDQPFALDGSATNAVGTIAAMTSTSIRFRNSGALTIGFITSPEEGVTSFGIVTNGHNAALTTGGNLRLTQPTNFGAATATFIAGGTIAGNGAVTAGQLAAQAVSGIGTAISPIRTQVGTIQAVTGTGGVFISNGVTLPTTLNVGAPTGVRVAGPSGDIQIANRGSIDILTTGGIVQGPGNITVQAPGTISDVATGGQSGNAAIRGTGSGVVSVKAGRDILLGGSTGFGAVQSVLGSISLTAGRNLVVDANAAATVLVGSGGLVANAGADIDMLTAPGTLAGAPVLATAGGDIALSALGTVTADSSGLDAVSSLGGNITVTAANLVVNKALNAGTGSVTLDISAGGTGEITDAIDGSVVNIVGGGAVFVDSPGGTIYSPVNLNAGTLGGTGTITGAVNIQPSTTLTPGHSGPGVFTTGTDTLSYASSFSVELSGPTPGNTPGSYGQLDVNGDVNLNNATLAAALTFVPSATQTFTLIQTTGNVSGQFAQSSMIVLNGITYSITYLPHSVVLAPAADIAVSLSGPASAIEGSTESYTYSVSNAGPGVAQNVVLTAPIPAGAVFGSASFGGAFNALPPSAYDPATGTVNFGTLPLGASGTLTLMVTLPEENHGVPFTASLASSTLDTNLSNNTDSITTQVTDAPLTAQGVNVAPSQGSKIFNNVALATFSDANLLATQSDFTATVNWGDGTTTSAQIVANSDGTFSVIASHRYANGKIKSFALSIQIVDDGGSMTTVTSTATLLPLNAVPGT
jgi:fibronectin-binding autotransporter adhesin